MIVGLMVAAFVAAAMAATLFRSQPSPGRQIASYQPVPASHMPVPASHKIIGLHQQAEFGMAGVADPFEVTHVLLDPNGQILVADRTNGRISAWSTSTGRPLGTFATLPDGVPASSQDLTSPAFSPDGTEFSVVGGAGDGPEVADEWNVATGRAVAVPLSSGSSANGPGDAVPGPNGMIADSNSNGTVGLATTTGILSDVEVVPRAIGYQLSEPTISSDGRAIAVSDASGVMHLVNVPDRQLVVSLSAEKIYNNVSDMNSAFSSEIDSVGFSPDSQLVACGTESGIVRVWDVATGRNVAAFSVSGSAADGAAARPVKTLIFSPDGKTLVTADDADGTLAEWDVATGREVATLSAGTGNVAAAAFTAAGKLVVATTSGASSGTIEIWSQ